MGFDVSGPRTNQARRNAFSVANSSLDVYSVSIANKVSGELVERKPETDASLQSLAQSVWRRRKTSPDFLLINT